MAVRIYLEIGHEASLRTKKTQEGFTHDWEVFVRGCDGAEIHYYIEKVVFYLHETFPKPKRVVKEPPYSVKESGYAGFNLPIDIYLRNNSEPKKIKFNYDLHLQPSGPAILKVQKEKYVFNNPTDEFKLKLLKGGGTVGGSSTITEVSDNRSLIDEKNQMINKPKLSGCDLMKKQKVKTGDPYNRDFQELFGSPIIQSSKSNLEQKQQVPRPEAKGPKAGEPYNRDFQELFGDPIMTSSKATLEQKQQDSKGVEKSRTKHSPHKDGHKEKDKSKDKSESKNKEEKKQKEKSKDRDRGKDRTVRKDKSPRPKSPSPKRSPKRSSSPARFSSPPIQKHNKDPKPHDSKEKRDRSEDKKLKKERRNKEHKENKHTDEQKNEEPHKEIKMKNELLKKESVKIKTPSPTPPKIVEKREKSKEKSTSRDTGIREEKNSEKAYAEKYKHKKRDKEKRDKREEKSHKSDKKSEKNEIKNHLFKPESQQKKEKVPTYIPAVDEDSSSSSSSSSSSEVERVPEKKVKSDSSRVKEEKNQKFKKEKVYQDSAIKCKRKSNSVEIDEPPEKVSKEHNNNSDIEADVDVKPPIPVGRVDGDYFEVLRDLQNKIMGLEDNNELQKVVELIAETGRYEVSAHTFDFDLCLLDRSTIKQLQEFFANIS